MVVDPWTTGSGHVDCTRVLDPGLTFDSSFDNYVEFLHATQPARSRLLFHGAYKSVPATQLNHPNIMVSHLRRGSISVRRTVTNVGGVDAVYNATVVEPSNAAVAVFPSSLRVAAGGTASFLVTFVLKTSKRQSSFQFGSLTWSDGLGHTVRSVLGVK